MCAAAGRASTGLQRILHVEPTHLRQPVSLIVGPWEDVSEAVQFLSQGTGACRGTPGVAPGESAVPAVAA